MAHRDRVKTLLDEARRDIMFVHIAHPKDAKRQEVQSGIRRHVMLDTARSRRKRPRYITIPLEIGAAQPSTRELSRDGDSRLRIIPLPTMPLLPAPSPHFSSLGLLGVELDARGMQILDYNPTKDKRIEPSTTFGFGWVQMGGWNRWAIHIGGLYEIIKLRGGLSRLERQLSTLAFWLDIVGRAVLDIPPQFSIPVHLSSFNPSENKVSPILEALLERLSQTHPQFLSLCEALRMTASVVHIVNVKTEDPGFWESDPKHWGSDSLEWRRPRWIDVSASGTKGLEQEELVVPKPGTYIGWSKGARDGPSKKFSQVEFVATMASLFHEWRVHPVQREGEGLQPARERVARLIDEDSAPVLLQQMLRPKRDHMKWTNVLPSQRLCQEVWLTPTPLPTLSPTITGQINKVMKILTSQNVSFTVKSGGHTPFAGGSNVADGVTIDLIHLDAITVSADRQTVSIGSFNRWINVSEALDPLKLAVVGGRSANVEVGGLILGGGISFFSGQKGWACDNVRNFEVVTASGKVVNASPTVNKDLYWALRGGDVWSNSVIFPGVANATVISHFQNLTTRGMPSDPAAHSFLAMTYQPAFGGYLINAQSFHANIPSAPETIPAVFAPIQSVPGAILNSTLIANISTHLRNIDIPYGTRQTWQNTFISATSSPLLTDIVSLFEARNTLLLAAAGEASFTPFLAIQSIPVNVIVEMQKNCRNALGLKPLDGPLVLLSLATTWEDPQLDLLIEDSTRSLIEKIESMAK
ncbi:FAD-dependent monooxygenase CTB5 [Paramyrothecium foliicola]|nr:FAD-dependent monooxygenase CTB5 [Paramyrothecium foliicola]